MIEKITKTQAGQVLVFTNGEYSDYDTCFVGIATTEFDFYKEQDEYKKRFEQDEEDYRYRGSLEGFIEYLIHKGLLVESNNLEIHSDPWGICGLEIDEIKPIK